MDAKEPTNGNVAIQRCIGLFSACMFLVGAIVGTGIFVSPKGVLQYSGSVGCALVIWIANGIVSAIGALCYIELGTTFPQSGSDFTYLRICLGELPAFLYLWVHMVIAVPANQTIIALTFSNYVLQPFFSHCLIPQTAVRMISILVLSLITFINCQNVSWATHVQNVFTMTKIAALMVIIVAGAYHLIVGHTENFEDLFEGTTKRPGSLTLAFYSGLYSYGGWNVLNTITEEVKDPKKNLPLAACISLPLVMAIYVLVNVAYFTVLTPYEILSSNAVAVTFSDHILGPVSWIMPLFIAVSTFGSLNGAIFANSRLIYVGAREGHLPNFLSLITLPHFTPAPSLIFMCTISLAYLFTIDVYSLINYVVFISTLLSTLCISGMIWMRYKEPDLERPIKLPLFVPLTYLIVSLFLVIFPLYESPWKAGIGIFLALTGIPVYFFNVKWEEKPKYYNDVIHKITSIVGNVLVSYPEEKTKAT